MNRAKPEETQRHPFQRHPIRVTLGHQLFAVNLHQEDIVDEAADPSNRDPAVRTIPPNELQNEIHFFRQENLSVNYPIRTLGPVFLNIVQRPTGPLEHYCGPRGKVHTTDQTYSSVSLVHSPSSSSAHGQC